MLTDLRPWSEGSIRIAASVHGLFLCSTTWPPRVAYSLSSMADPQVKCVLLIICLVLWNLPGTKTVINGFQNTAFTASISYKCHWFQDFWISYWVHQNHLQISTLYFSTVIYTPQNGFIEETLTAPCQCCMKSWRSLQVLSAWLALHLSSHALRFLQAKARNPKDKRRMILKGLSNKQWHTDGISLLCRNAGCQLIAGMSFPTKKSWCSITDCNYISCEFSTHLANLFLLCLLQPRLSHLRIYLP